jgi:antitoxin ParD1/3/4
MTLNKDKNSTELRPEQQAKLDTLRKALIEGEQSGPSTPFDFDEFIKQMCEEWKSKR